MGAAAAPAAELQGCAQGCAGQHGCFGGRGGAAGWGCAAQPARIAARAPGIAWAVQQQLSATAFDGDSCIKSSCGRPSTRSRRRWQPWSARFCFAGGASQGGCNTLRFWPRPSCTLKPFPPPSHLLWPGAKGSSHRFSNISAIALVYHPVLHQQTNRDRQGGAIQGQRCLSDHPFRSQFFVCRPGFLLADHRPMHYRRTRN